MADYSRDEAEEILRRALAREQRDGVNHDDLIAAAAEVGIDAAEVERAARELAQEQESQARQGAIRAELRRQFYQSVSTALGFNGLMLAIDLMTGPGFWVQWVALFTALHLGGRAVRTFAPSSDTLRAAEKRIDRRERRRRKREDRHTWARDERERRKQAEAQFERVVEEGVEALLRGAGDRLERYNASQRQRVRVADPGDGRERDSDSYPPYDKRKRRDT